MERTVFAQSVQGTSHLRTGKPCQDHYGIEECDAGTVIMAVADGHGSDACRYSESGSLIAVNVFCRILKDYYKNYRDNLEFLGTFLNREGDMKVAQAIEKEWKARVKKSYRKREKAGLLPEGPACSDEEIYRLYGSTLVGMMMTPAFLFAFQIGDGDITYIDEKGLDPVIAGEKILGIETHSLCRKDAWKKAVSVMVRRDINAETPFVILLSTDGLSNSYKSEEEFRKCCRDYYALLCEHGCEAVSACLKEWLLETSELGCGDDITALFVCYFNNK